MTEIYSFPEEGVSIEAESLEEALIKLKELVKPIKLTKEVKDVKKA